MVTPRSDAGGNDGWTPTNRPPSRTSATACSWSTAASATVSQPVVGSAVKSAPRPRTNSSSAARASPVTRQPRSSASWTTYPPTAPAAPVTSSDAALAVAEDVDELERGERVERDGGRLDQVEAVRYDGHVGGRQHQLLGIGAEVAVEPADQPGHAGPRRQVDAGAGLEDGAGEVPAQAGVLRLVDDARLVQHRRRGRGRRPG